jgi:hypothetical protein
MPKQAFVFAAIVALVGAGVVITAAVSWHSVTPAPFLVVAALALLAATFKVRIPGVTGAISPVSVPILFAAGTFGWQAAAVIAAGSAILQCIWRPKTRPSALQAAFNSATMTLSAAVATFTAGLTAPAGSFVWFIAAAMVYQVVNAFLVSVILSLLSEGITLGSLWRHCHLWSFPYQLAAGLFAGLWAQAAPLAEGNATPLAAIALAGVLLYLMNAFYREIVDRSGITRIGLTTS